MGRPAFGFLALALAIAHLRHVTAILALVTLPAFGGPSTTVTAVELGVDSKLGYTTYRVQAALSEEGPTQTHPTPITIPFTASVSAKDLRYKLGDECDLKSRSAVCVEHGMAQTVPLASLVPWVIDVVSTAAPSSPTSNNSNTSRSPASYGVLFVLKDRESCLYGTRRNIPVWLPCGLFLQRITTGEFHGFWKL
ncbi:hypothetical protein DFH09DRAFT_1079361 [Mycena vulgaris]|nr:hypothetical protein DFH09DRAFT_1079361 [Mycena vulgaris]